MTSDSGSDPIGVPRGITVNVVHDAECVDVYEVERLVQSVVRAESAKVHSLGVVLCRRELHVALHRKYLGKPSPTDVLAFNLEPGSTELDGEIYVDLDTARERHAEFGATFNEEVYRYVVHGLLHLLGYSDEQKSAARKMRERQELLLRTFLQRPA